MEEDTIIAKILFSFFVVILSYMALFFNEDKLIENLPVKVEVVSNFKNEDGTAKKLCCHKGCSRRVANNGQTKNCEEHSAKCQKCGKLISEGLTYCKECMIKYDIKF